MGDEQAREEGGMEMDKTCRGFAKAEFVDRYGAKCSIQDSSLCVMEEDPPGSSCVWLGVDEYEMHGLTQDGARMHLTQNQVYELLPLLKRFVQTGSIAECPHV